MTGIVETDELDEFVEDDLVFDNDILTWSSVIRASRVEKERFNLIKNGATRAGNRFEF